MASTKTAYNCSSFKGITKFDNSFFVNLMILDINECTTNNHTCDGNATCVNVPEGTFSCLPLALGKLRDCTGG